MDDLEGKVVIITGCSSGIGLAATETFLKLGSKVFGCDVHAIPAAGPLSSASSSHFVFLQTNLTLPGTPKDIVKGCIEAFGGDIHGLLNVAGVMDAYSSVDTVTDSLWDRVMAVNLTAPVKLMRETVPHMLKGGGGSIVNVSSKSGMSGASAGVAYTSSKHGLVGATKNVAWRFKDDHIRCNVICPGGFSTNIVQSINVNDIDQEALKTATPVHKLNVNPTTGETHIASPQAAADVLAFLVSDLSSEISGAVLPVDRAWSAA